MTANEARGRKTIFITGAASGMGRETARLFAAKGWYVGAADIDETGLATLAQELGNENCFVRRLDVTDRADYAATLDAFGQATGGKLDMLFNNAGIGVTGWFEDASFDQMDRLIDINFKAVVTGIKLALPLLKATQGSFIFTTSSSSATYGMPRIALYSATKHAVKGLTEALSIELARENIRVADVLPGLIDTPILTNSVNPSNDLPADRRPQDQAPKTGMFRLMPATAVAECAWEAYHNPTKLHYYVPKEVAWIDRIKGIWPEFMRDRLKKNMFARLLGTKP